ncbi:MULTISPECIES: DUF1905 domain-containing protein [unclassified Amycolatopsis]|uniref:DUF1905 domain-containing protein n=1 Tax=unclassified Amycolatopsis TaxID=2618356 RepID=UPI00106E2A91|nr:MULTISPECIES: DUF1905 domain-containing protein [unclassified Amycolatopsis]
MEVHFDAELWIWDARRTETWTFVSLPGDISDEIRELGGPRRGFGSRRVLPVKRAVRKAEKLDPGDVAQVTVTVLDL